MMQLHCFAKRAPFPGALERLGLGARGGTLSASPMCASHVNADSQDGQNTHSCDIIS